MISTCVGYVSKALPRLPAGDPICVTMTAKLEVQVLLIIRATGIHLKGNPSARNAFSIRVKCVLVCTLRLYDALYEVYEQDIYEGQGI